jgi:hypothetical protein
MKDLRLVAAFAVGFGLAVLAGELPIATGAPFGGSHLVLDRDPPAEPGYYYGFNSYGGIEHDVFYFAQGDSVANARASDVIAFGHSHVQLALRPEFVVPEMKALGLRFFDLAFAPAESVGWATELIRRHDLHPKIALAHVGGFFVPRESFYVALMRASDSWTAWKRIFEFQGRWELSRRILRVLPYFAWSPLRPPLPYDLYRSSVHGSWYAVREPKMGIPLQWPPVPPPAPTDSIELARQFKDEIESRGGRLVLFQVPSPLASPDNARQIADALGVPLLEVSGPDFTLTDPGHLDSRSSALYVRALMEQFAALPEVERVRRDLAEPH